MKIWDLINLIKFMFQNLILKKEVFERWRMGLNIKGNIILRQDSDVEKEFKFGQMVHDMKDTGNLIKPMDKAV